MTEKMQTFTPNWISPPGDTIADILEERDWTQVELAERIGLSKKQTNLLLKGKAPITSETALKLESVLGSTAKFWLNREVQYRESIARTEELENLKEHSAWVGKLPIKHLMRIGILEKKRIDSKNKPLITKELLQFFKVASPDGWESKYGNMNFAFRRTKKEQSDIGAISSWIRLGEIEAEKNETPKYEKNKFLKSLEAIRALTKLSPEEFEPKLLKLCSDSGVVLVIVPAIPKAHVSGVARWVNPHKPLIQLSLYGKSNDRFWFTFFHEAAHILLHDKEKQNVYLDEFDDLKGDSKEEIEADIWASNYLIPEENTFEFSSLTSRDAVLKFAQKINLHPGIVVGRLQHEEIILYSWLNDLKDKFVFVEDEEN